MNGLNRKIIVFLVVVIGVGLGLGLGLGLGFGLHKHEAPCPPGMVCGPKTMPFHTPTPSHHTPTPSHHTPSPPAPPPPGKCTGNRICELALTEKTCKLAGCKWTTSPPTGTCAGPNPSCHVPNNKNWCNDFPGCKWTPAQKK